MGGRDVDVAIVGAGLAGLTAARILSAQDVTVCILEARDRVGGRTLSQDIDGARFDMGGQWLGPTQWRMAKLVAEFDLETFPTHHEGRKILETNGKVSRYEGTIPKIAPHKLLLLNATLNSMDRESNKVSTSAPWDAPDAADRDSATVASFIRRRTPSKAARNIIEAAVRVIFGADPSEISLLYFLFYLRSGGGMMNLVEIENGAQQTRFVAGAQSVALHMADELKHSLVTSAPVYAVEQDREGVIVRSQVVEVHAKRAVIAVPPPLSCRIAYSPALASVRDSLLQRHPMGATIKTHVLYDEAFWREEGLSGEAVCSSGPFDVVFDNCTHDGSRAALLTFACGSRAHYLARLDAGARRRIVIDGLTKLFGRRANRPSDYVEKDWAQEEWTRGCPTGFMTPGALSSFGPALRSPAGRLHWAGTETASEGTGYMEGAVESGERAAAEILQEI